MNKIATLDGYFRVEQWYQNAADELEEECNKKRPNADKIKALEEKMEKYGKMMDEFQKSNKFNHKEYSKLCGDFWAFR